MIESKGVAADLGLRLQPMVHVQNLADALCFYEALGAKLLFGSRDGDWAMVQLGSVRLGLLAHPPGDGKRETVELQFTSSRPLGEVEAHVRRIDPGFIARGVADEAFGRMLKLQTKDGLLVKIVEVDRDLVE